MPSDERSLIEAVQWMCATGIMGELADRIAPAIGEAMKGSRGAVLGEILQLIQSDPHQWSARPCATCLAISSLAGKPFGCMTRKEG
jgi:hypothetical protein